MRKQIDPKERERNRPYWIQEFTKFIEALYASAIRLARGDGDLAWEAMSAVFLKIIRLAPDPHRVGDVKLYSMARSATQSATWYAAAKT